MQKESSHPLLDAEVEIILGHVEEADIPRDLPTRRWLYAWMLDPDVAGNHQRETDKWIGVLIVANLFALLFEHVPILYEPNKTLFSWFDAFSVVIFTTEYLFRLYLAPEERDLQGKRFARLHHACAPLSVFDLLAIAPFYLQAIIPVDLRILRFLRLLRILKLFRVLVPAWHHFSQLNRGRSVRQKIHALMFDSIHSGEMHHLLDNFIAMWVVISVAAVILESVASVHYALNMEFLILDTLAVLVFSVEFLMRLYSCVEEPRFKNGALGRLKHAKSMSALVDLLAVLPFFLEPFLNHLLDLRFLRVFRLIRLLKLTRYTGATTTLTKVIAREWGVVSAAAFIMILMVIMMASLGYLFEHDVQPDKFENIPQSIYWAVVTLASVGYGDISPVTPAGRAMTIVMALMGIGIFAIPAALLSSAFSDQLQKEREALKGNIYRMIATGNMDPEAVALIRTESKRLHLTAEELGALIEKAHEERESKEDLSSLSLHEIARNPHQVIEFYKQQLGQLRQLGLLTDLLQVEAIARSEDHLTPTDIAVWNVIQRRTPTDPPPR